MKSRTSKASANRSKRRKGLSRTAKVVGATTVGALAGGLVGTAIARRKRTSSALGKAARKLKGWAKSAASNPTVKTWAKDVAKQVVESQLSPRSFRKGPGRSAMEKSTSKAKAKR